jgi:glucosamine 6-phosphate synthetase-like amidotransferase/phosphosugar isomerase protein
VAARAIDAAEAWADAALARLGRPVAAIAAGGGTSWAAALELALMLKEVSRLPAEGVETREGATSAMFGLDRGHLMVSLDPADDPLGAEAMRLCAAAGATTLRLPEVDGADPRLAPIATLPAAAALAAGLALAAGHDVDRPAWTDAYYETARGAPSP